MMALKAAEHVFKGSGPYRRVWSQPGFVGVRATIVLPPAGAIKVERGPTEDTVYTYSGGWGEGGHAVDAGLQHSPTNDDWALVVLTRDGKEPVRKGDGPRFAPGSRIEFAFEVLDDNVLQVRARSDDGHGERSIRLGASDGAEGWGPGRNQVIKRMVSIAQCEMREGKKVAADRFACGTVAGPVRWEEVRLVDFDGNLIDWQKGHAGYQNYPPVTSAADHFRFDWKDFNAETVTIDLS